MAALRARRDAKTAKSMAFVCFFCFTFRTAPVGEEMRPRVDPLVAAYRISVPDIWPSGFARCYL
eukprot:134648-Rhodomonas_salina.2